MNVRAIPRTAARSYLRLARLPLDGAVRLLPGNGTGAAPAARLVIDRADVRVRAAIAALLSDPELRKDAEQRRRALRERERSLDLRTESERTAERAEAGLEERQEQARVQRRRAAQRAKSTKRQAETRAQQEKARAAKAESRRLENSQQLEERRQEQIDEREPRERLQALEAETEALRERETELTARDEARRLGEAAAVAKAERKSED